MGGVGRGEDRRRNVFVPSISAAIISHVKQGPPIKTCTPMSRSRDRFVAVATILAIYQGRLLPSDGFCCRTLPIRPRHPLLLAPLLANNNQGVNKCSRESSSAPSLSPFHQFEDEVLDRIAHAQENGDNSSKIVPEELKLSLVDCGYIEKLARSTSRKTESSYEIEHGLTNGYFLLKLKEDDAKIMGDLWECAEELFSLDGISLRHQVLGRNDTTADPDSNGYKYIETTRVRCDGSFVLLPDDGIENAIGKDKKKAVLSTAYNLLENIGRLTTTALLKASMTDTSAIDDLMTFLPDSGQVSKQYGEEDSALSCTMQRICCYPSLPRGEGLDERETLRAHTDWSILTLVPLSAVPGLEMWDSQFSTWIRPEAVDKVSTEYCKYIVVMAGKWLELLSMGRIPATIHRVIASKGSNRLSTPLFYRPRQHVPSMLQEKYGTVTAQIEGTPQEDMGKFLLELFSKK